MLVGEAKTFHRKTVIKQSMGRVELGKKPDLFTLRLDFLTI